MNKKRVVVLLGAALVVLLVGIALYFYLKNNNTPLLEKKYYTKQSKYIENIKEMDWTTCKNIGTTFLAPKNWYVLEENADYIKACFISKESIEKEGEFKTGLSVNKLTNIKNNFGVLPSEYSKMHLAEVTKNVQMETRIFRSAESERAEPVGYRFGYSKKYKGYEISAFYSIFHDDNDDSVLIFWFESPTSSWEENWNSYGVPLTSIQTSVPKP